MVRDRIMKICVGYVVLSNKNEIYVCPYSHTENSGFHACELSDQAFALDFRLTDPLLVEFIKNNATPELSTEIWSIIELDD